MRTLKLKTPTWTAAIPARWADFSVQFSNDIESGFVGFAGSKFMAQAGSLIRGSGEEVERLFDGMILHGLAEELAAEDK